MSKPEQLSDVWEDKFGEDYTKRKLLVHEDEGKHRAAFWKELVKMVPNARSYLEIGCNAGMNLEAIYKVDPKLKITGIEPNKYAYSIAKEKAKGKYEIINENIFDLSSALKADIVFTCTVLIHIAPKDLPAAMENIYKASNNYILAMEYYWPLVKSIEYRGLKDVLWKQDFGLLWLQKYNLNLMETGYLDARDGFDRVTWWLLKK
jgi:pseudaminic acid biosynthesis-associated methylase